jgi:hypothetical protein
VRPRSTYYRRGTVLWHGTNAGEGFRDLRGPAWVSDSREVARLFAGFHKNGAQDPARIMKYVVDVPFSLPTYDGRGAVATVSGLLPMAAWIERLTRHDFDGVYNVGDMVDAVCRAGFPGWRVVMNYETGDDIMLCRPERFLRRVSTRGAWRP